MKRVVNINWFDVWDAIKKGMEVCVLRCGVAGSRTPLRPTREVQTADGCDCIECIEFNRLTFMMVTKINSLIESCRSGEDVVFFSVEDGEE